MHVLEVFTVFLRLGLSSFGGPVAHLGFFRAEFVERRAWLSDAEYAELVAVANFLPGPSSSQVGLAVGLRRAGWAGAGAAWLGFTLPSALLMALLGGTLAGGAADGAGWVQGVKLAAVAVVAQAVAGMWGALVTDRVRAGLALGAAAALLVLPAWWPGAGGWGTLGVLGLCAVIGWRTLRGPAAEGRALRVPVSRRAGGALLALCAALAVTLAGLSVLGGGWALLWATFRAGALVFGGGHVVLPLLESAFVPGLLADGVFVAGYGAANAMPGPLFTFASYLGAAAAPALGLGAGVGALLGTLGIFLPGALLMLGALPFWSALSGRTEARAALAGVNAGVVGLLLAALYTPVFTGAVRGPADLAGVLLAYAALTAGRVPAWVVVPLCAALGWLLGGG
ncbi:chromate efflux transporter [Deinococcus soli (ex Cha et al. 2016)]|uniref:Chromate transporter n=2 Tax=Deinococcus soli (ex Cha et al. 2016) TaxID=1309411 RepID=A0ACC6KNG5_9DEIO|nr:chromate efflux transporter [Deinococcus soli (ex Cha et al. 2016)]MDR6220924.1 chromate transporter [Deinococcus soli (ex Cha et al. 2016)]MDR6330892.1 chromate transporter [Deinococcus soli (ex Cha et al. 2016)]MDR6754078.1 chromate transporter [Deinococcus soli (ex Cha et al. 2016)]